MTVNTNHLQAIFPGKHGLASQFLDIPSASIPNLYMLFWQA